MEGREREKKKEGKDSRRSTYFFAIDVTQERGEGMRRGKLSILVKREQVFFSFRKDFERWFELRKRGKEGTTPAFVWREKKGGGEKRNRNFFKIKET